MQLVSRPPVVGEQQEPEPDLGDEQGLRQREQVRDEAAGAAPPPEHEPADERRQRRHADHQEGEGVVRR